MPDTFTTIDVPGALYTYADDINGAGEIAGFYYEAINNKLHGFAGLPGSFITIDFPGARNTQVFGLNDAGQLVGNYVNYNVTTDSDIAQHGFVYTNGSFTTIDFPGAIVTS